MIYLDTEFKDAQEPIIDMVMFCTKKNEERPKCWWIYRDKDKQQQLKDYLLDNSKETFVSYSSTAEARCIAQLGIDIRKLRFADVRVMYKLANNTPNSEHDYSDLLDACSRYGVQHAYENSKKEMIDLILNTKKYSDTEQKEIMKYCCSDVIVLPPLYERIMTCLKGLLNKSDQEILLTVQYLSAFSAFTSIIEQEGIPIDIKAVNNIINNQRTAITYMIEECNKVYPFYLWNGSKFQKSTAVIEEYITTSGLGGNWPKTPTGKYCMDSKKVMDKRKYDSKELFALSTCEKLIHQLASFNPARTVIKEHIGKDNRLRAYFGTYGTITSRNAPKARYFPFAISKAFRSIIKPPSGYAITGIDWGSQEFAIAAELSGDTEMMDSYASGDVYISFAIKAGAVPPGSTKHTHPDIRQKFKATVLGLQYGMGAESLYKKLSIDCKTTVTKQEAQNLIDLHKRVYKGYWRWVEKHIRRIKNRELLKVKDGWMIQSDGVSVSTLKNWPVQSSGAVILRYAVIVALKRGLRIIAPLHDAIYLLHKEDDTMDMELLKQCMKEAVAKFFPGLSITMDAETHNSKETWIEDLERYEIFKQFLSDDCQIKTDHFVNPLLDTYNLFEEIEELKETEEAVEEEEYYDE